MRMPSSMDECIYFTRRKYDTNDGKAIAWVYKKECPKCKKGTMGKPLDPKTGRPKIRSDMYECPECKYSEPGKEHEESLMVEIVYTCPFCGHSGEATTEYKRKSWEGVKAYVYECGGCKAKLGITKKMKTAKEKKKK